jgi:hypothetical protein
MTRLVAKIPFRISKAIIIVPGLAVVVVVCVYFSPMRLSISKINVRISNALRFYLAGHFA